MSDANIETKIIYAAICAAINEGEVTETRSGCIIHRYRRNPWLIAVTRTDPKAPEVAVLVIFNRQAVFHAVGQVAEPEVVTFDRGEWEAQLLAKWGP